MSTVLQFSWMTAQVDGTEHAVTDEAQVAGMDAGDGRYEAVCAARFLAACMDVGPLRKCPGCCAFVRAHVEHRDRPEPMNRDPNWLSRLCHRRRPGDAGGEPTSTSNATTSTGPRHRRGRHKA